MNTVETIKNALDDMTRSERMVASFYLSHPGEFAFCTLDAIAAKVDTSTTSVLRFCRRIGFQGYKDLQNSAREQISHQPQLPDKFQRSVSSGDDLLMRVLNRGMQCIQDTFQGLDQQAIAAAVILLSEAKRVYAFGLRESYSLSHYACTRLMSVRPNVEQLQAGNNGQIESLLNIGQEDVCIVFLFHRYTQQTLRFLELLSKRKIRVVLVTDPTYAQLEDFATVVLPCYVDRSGIKNTSVAPVMILDYLCDAVAAKLGDAALEHMQQAETLFRLGEVL